MLTNCLAKCAHLTITVSQIERDIGRKSSFFHTHLAFDAPVMGVPSEYRHPVFPFSTEKLEWLGYQVLKKCRFGATHERDRQTDRQSVPAYTAHMHSIAR